MGQVNEQESGSAHAAPKVFVSHASEDKARFVEVFAARLRADGIDAWLDKWEMLPGDSLVDKIFNEGLKSADAIAIVLSRSSIEKPWVREELNAAMVGRISKQTRIIPIVIDPDIAVPEPLRSTIWQVINDTNAYDDEYGLIVAAIRGESVRPPLGPQPDFIRKAEIGFGPTLQPTDNAIFELLCDAAMDGGHYLVTDARSVLKRSAALGIADSAALESIGLLDELGYIKAHWVITGSLSYVEVSVWAFERYAAAKIPEYDSLRDRMAYAIANSEQITNHDLIAQFEQPRMVVRHVLKYFESQGSLTLSETMGDNIRVFKTTVSFRRRLQNLG